MPIVVSSQVAEVAVGADTAAPPPAPAAAPLVDYHSNGHGNVNGRGSATGSQAYTNGNANNAAASSSANGHSDQGQDEGEGEGGEAIVAQASGQRDEDDEDDEDDDWLMSDDEVHAGPSSRGMNGAVYDDQGDTSDMQMEQDAYGEERDPSPSSSRLRQKEMQMASRDSAKVQRTFYDTGYREGITAGKLSTLQQGFDEGFNVAAPVGRTRGVLRGQANAAHFYLSEYRNKRGGAGGVGAAGRRRGVASMGTGRSQDAASAAVGISPHLDEAEKESVCGEARSILTDLDALDVDVLLEPDWEARQHEAEHRGGDNANATLSLGRESDEARTAREGRLPEVRGRVEAVLGKVLR